MEIRQLKIFRVLADTLSFTQTGEKLFMAQSSVSAQIKSLEDDLGTKLFDRIGRNVILTEAGRKLYDYARRMEEMTDEIRSEVSGNQSTAGSLTIRVPETLAAFYMPGIIERFSQTHPNVKLSFINCTDRQLKEELNTGRIDLAFLMTDTAHFKDVNVKFLKTQKLVLAAGPSHPLAQRPSLCPADLSHQRVLLTKTDCSYRKAFERALAEMNISPMIFEFSSFKSMKTCLSMGLGITICPDIAIEKELETGRLVTLEMDLIEKETSVIMIWHAQKWCSPALNQFLVITREEIH